MAIPASRTDAKRRETRDKSPRVSLPPYEFKSCWMSSSERQTYPQVAIALSLWLCLPCMTTCICTDACFRCANARPGTYLVAEHGRRRQQPAQHFEMTAKLGPKAAALVVDMAHLGQTSAKLVPSEMRLDFVAMLANCELLDNV